MANKTKKAEDIVSLLENKMALLHQVLDLTREQLLLVDLEKLTPLLERMDELMERITQVDQRIRETGQNQGVGWEALPQHKEMAGVIQSILENEAVLEERMQAEFAQLRDELRDLNKETRLKKYLEGQKPRKGRVDLKQ